MREVTRENPKSEDARKRGGKRNGREKVIERLEAQQGAKSEEAKDDHVHGGEYKEIPRVAQAKRPLRKFSTNRG
jgi:hypothetical protein